MTKYHQVLLIIFLSVISFGCSPKHSQHLNAPDNEAIQTYENALDRGSSPQELQHYAYIVAATHQNQGYYDIAYKYHKKRLEHILSDSSMDINFIASAYNNLGSVEKLRGNLKEAEYYLDQIDLDDDLIHKTQKYFVLVNYAGLYLKKDMPLKAQECFMPIYKEFKESLEGQDLLLLDIESTKLRIEYLLNPDKDKLEEIETIFDKMESIIGKDTPFADESRKLVENLRQKLPD